VNIAEVKRDWLEPKQHLGRVKDLWDIAFPKHRLSCYDIRSSDMLNFMCWVMNCLTLAGLPRSPHVDQQKLAAKIWPLLMARGLSNEEMKGIISYATTQNRMAMDHIDPHTADWTGLRFYADKWQPSANATVYPDSALDDELQKSADQIDLGMALAAAERLKHNRQIILELNMAISSLVQAKLASPAVAAS
jgi:hypothetical protein